MIFEVPDARVGDDDVETPEARDGVIDELLVGGVPPDVDLESLACANNLTAAAPMPREPPVMTAALPASEIMMPPKRPKRLNR
jgi:hypothetical protein